MKPRTVVLPAQFRPSLDAALDKLLLDVARGEIPEWGLANGERGEVLEITVRKVSTPASRRWSFFATPMQRWAVAVRLPMDIDGCWQWTGGLDADGYGSFSVHCRNVRAHRYAYERFVGSIPDGLVIDHVCRNPSCVNPSHLEVVTQRENILRGESPGAQFARRDTCNHGHLLSGDNLILDEKQVRICRTCKIAKDRNRRLRALAGGDVPITIPNAEQRSTDLVDLVKSIVMAPYGRAR